MATNLGLNEITADTPLDEGRPVTPNPWFSMWLQPRATIRALVAESPRRSKLLVITLGGIAYTLSNSLGSPIVSRLSLAEVLLLSIVLGGLGGGANLWLTPLILNVTGKWLGGRAGDDELRVALAWSYVPFAWTLLPWIPALLLAGKSIFNDSMGLDELPLPLAFLHARFVLTIVLAGPWFFVVHLKALSEVQGFSVWRAFASLLLAGLVLALPVLAIALLVLQATG